jgi:hypothetical protein
VHLEGHEALPKQGNKDDAYEKEVTFTLIWTEAGGIGITVCTIVDGEY